MPFMLPKSGFIIKPALLADILLPPVFQITESQNFFPFHAYLSIELISK
jgi:hypothetical protein